MMVDAAAGPHRLQAGRLTWIKELTMASENSEERGEAPDDREEEIGTGAPEGAAGGGFAYGLVVGILLGAGLALMFAPERGDRARDRLRKRLRQLREDAAEGLDRAGARTRKELLRRRKQLRDLR
jgi:hypothetical protein